MQNFINIEFCISDYKLLKNMALGDPRIREFTSLVEWNIISCKGLRPFIILNVECYTFTYTFSHSNCAVCCYLR